MQKTSDTRHPQRPAAVPARRAWSTPELVAYGHLAKLTRGSSGTMGEASGMMVCL